ncbi:deoxyribodipyrimidine photolyase [Thiocapsa imhoffii]|uniref:Deoxyribodipyrimidine photo-lyase n=1 Tax=Thiocapsa imhoffii TaxID=382777 RepID=A0A9X1B8Y8_9GAMM|nr:deoxyribodipyrimidine photo-lyase [Thiocapsa imhoffii]MBK1644733.1 deoxyribodipyrimidine photolyase [Thiocapsa imhoffii]
MPNTAILWFRRDLRLDDNPALHGCLSDCDHLLPLYIHEPEEEAPWVPGAASRWWLHGSLAQLAHDLRSRGSQLLVTRGDSLDTLTRIASATGARTLHWNRLYDPATRERDTRVKQALRAAGIKVVSHPGSVLFEPWEIASGSGEPYRVFSAFWRRCGTRLGECTTLDAPVSLPPAPPLVSGLALDELMLRPRIPWDSGLQATWTPGEAAAHARARTFLHTHAADYRQQRDRPDRTGTSALSPALHFGELSPRRLLRMVTEIWEDPSAEPIEPFVRELGWREFAHHLLYHYPHTTDAPLDPRFAALPWRETDAERLLEAWQRGATGIPLVDAGMRELWELGWMHNRTRMVVASFLTKNLRLPWQLGARWFWDTLVDADLAANTLGWQWSAGCGADAAPYFRIFNPVLQGERFDPRGDYVRRWCPELGRLPVKFIHRPWMAPPAVLDHAGLRLGREYPAPIVDLQDSRAAALAAYETIKGRAR